MKFPKMTLAALAGLAGGCGTCLGFGSGGILHHGHVDCVLEYVNGQWTMGYRHETGGNPLDAPSGGPLLSVASTVLAARDQPYTVGSRVIRPVPPEWDFTGVAESAPLWWFPQTSWAEGNYVGFTMNGPFAIYQETDPRLAGNGPERWGRVNAESKRYRGKGTGHFSMWTNSTTSGLKVWVDSRDGFQVTDRYFVGGNGHGHPAMGFSSLGLYEINYRGRAWLDAEQTQEVVSPAFNSYVAVGTYAIWIAEHFSPQRWFQDAVSGELADPDGDGLTNLMEYACGLDPRKADADPAYLPIAEMQESGAVLVTTRQRSTPDHPQIRYQWEEAERPDALEWTPVQPLSHGISDGKWETVKYLMPAPVPGTPQQSRFGRLRVELLVTPDYL